MEELIKSVQNDPILKAKLQMLALAIEYGSVTLACEKAGFSRDTFYRVKRRFDEGGVEALSHRAKGRENLKARIASEVEERIIAIAQGNPSYGKLRIAKMLRQEGIVVSPAGVRLVLVRKGLWEAERRAQLVMDLAKKVGSIFG